MKFSKLGNVIFSVVSEENVMYENEVTDRPVEDLGYISDHVKNKPIKFNISGVITGTDVYPKLKLLREYSKGKKVYKYYGRNIFEDVVIESFETGHGKDVRNGFTFSMSLKIIKRAISKTIVSQGVDPVKSLGNTNKLKSKNTTSQTKQVYNKGKIVMSVAKTDKQKHDEKMNQIAYLNKRLSKNTSQNINKKLDRYRKGDSGGAKKGFARFNN